MITRRKFLQASAALALVPMLPRGSLAATSLRTRLSWPAFRTSPSYGSFLYAVRTMRANLDSTKPASWFYWTSVHATHCPHGKPYFLAWHRGFLARFEAQLRKVSGNSALVLPYWNYYRDPVLPAEFTDPTSPLYRADRVGSNVAAALSLASFADTNFQRGTTNAFEPAVESSPHNGVHNLIGGSMSNITVSPRDPIFWLHHANIDRLWDGWVHAGYGRHMPATTSSYWSGSFSYGAAVPGVTRLSTYSPTNFGYRYENILLPTALPASTQAVSPQLLSAMQDLVAAPLPAQGSSLVGLGGVVLGPRSARVRLPLTPAALGRVRSVLTGAESPSAAAGEPLRVVLDGVSVARAGASGGYFYKILLNLPAQGVAQAEQSYLVGTLGPFEIGVAAMAAGSAMAMHGSARIVLPIASVLRRSWPVPLDALTLSFVRVDAGAPPPGEAIVIDRLWLEADEPR